MPSETKSEVFLIRATRDQLDNWREAAVKAGLASSMSEWIRATLDAATGQHAEIVADEHAVCLYVPNRATDKHPYVIDLATCAADPLAFRARLADLAKRPWCRAETLRDTLLALDEAIAQRAKKAGASR